MPSTGKELHRQRAARAAKSKDQRLLDRLLLSRSLQLVGGFWAQVLAEFLTSRRCRRRHYNLVHTRGGAQTYSSTRPSIVFVLPVCALEVFGATGQSCWRVRRSWPPRDNARSPDFSKLTCP